MRQQLNNRRGAVTFVFQLGGLDYTASVGRFPDGRMAELFLNSTKVGSQADLNAKEAAIAVSLALQFGCPLEVLAAALPRNERGEPNTPASAALALFQQQGH
jgi:hypothetical protein